MNPYCFTFGHGQEHGPKGYVAIYARSSARARELMFQSYGSKWSMQYPSPAEAGVQEFQLHCIQTIMDDCPACPMGMGFSCKDCQPMDPFQAYLLDHFQASLVPELASHVPLAQLPSLREALQLITQRNAWLLPVADLPFPR